MAVQLYDSREIAALIRRVKNGDQQAFAQLISATEGLVIQILFKMVPDQEDRRDLAQDVYLKVYRNLPGFRQEAKFSTWVGQIAYNTAVNYLRKKKLVLSDPAEREEEGAGALTQWTQDFPEIDLAIHRKELAVTIREAMDRLSPLQRTLIALYHYQEQSYEDMALITGLPIGTIKSYLFRARKALKDILITQFKLEPI
jgi:RNA polymerase sigma-70 factor (ECF subfamily)